MKRLGQLGDDRMTLPGALKGSELATGWSDKLNYLKRHA